MSARKEMTKQMAVRYQRAERKTMGASSALGTSGTAVGAKRSIEVPGYGSSGARVVSTPLVHQRLLGFDGSGVWAEVAVERRATPPDQTCRVFGGAHLGAGILRDRELVRDHRRVRERPAKAGTRLPGRGDHGIDALHDQFSLILGQGGQHVQHHPPRGCRRVDPVRNGSDLQTAFAQEIHSVQHIDQGSAEPVDSPAHHGVPGLGVLQELFHPGPLDRGPAAGGDVGEHVALLYPGLDQGVELQLRILA